MQHFTTLGNAAYTFFKTFRTNPAWAKCVGRDRGGGLNIFAKIGQHTCTISFPERLCAYMICRLRTNKSKQLIFHLVSS